MREPERPSTVVNDAEHGVIAEPVYVSVGFAHETVTDEPAAVMPKVSESVEVVWFASGV